MSFKGCIKHVAEKKRKECLQYDLGTAVTLDQHYNNLK